MTVRPALAAELPAAAALAAASDATGSSARAREVTRTPPPLESLRLLHDEDSHQVWIAARDGRVLGVAMAAFRERHAHIQRLVVSRHANEADLGALLGSLHEAARAAGCRVITFHTPDDPRALAPAFRLGLAPRTPSVVWSATAPSFPRPRLDNPFEAMPLSADDEATLNTAGDIDKAVRGVRRLRDLRRWLGNGERGHLLIDRTTGRPAGAFLVSLTAGRGRIGPVAAMDQARFAEVLERALVAAAEIDEPGARWGLVCPGDNRAAIAPLLAGGFQPIAMLAFFASGPIGQFDRYTFHDPDFL